jgi:hypothetical protein
MRRSTLPFLAVAAVVASAAATAQPARAGGCFEDPVFERAATAKITTGARVRDVACMEGSTVLTTLAVGTTVALVGETDGWYKVKTSGGTVGWVGMQLMSITDSSRLPDFGTSPVTTIVPAPAPSSLQKSALRERLKGYILLQAQQRGEAWYVHPVDSRRYYLKDGPTAYQMMRAFGLGISNADLERLQDGNADLRRRLKGRILLQVQAHGEAWYVHPETGVPHYMKDGAAAYELMRAKSLGITESDLSAFAEGSLAQ